MTAEDMVLDRVQTNAVFEDYLPQAEMTPVEERVLLGVDYLLNRRLPDGTYTDGTLEGAHVNYVTATKEMAIPHAISEIQMERVAEGTYLFNDRTSIEVAQSGYKYHYHPAARERVGVEVAEAEHNAFTLEPSMVRIFISPRMSKADAPQEVAEQEHLANDDALRVTGLAMDEAGNPTHMTMQAILIKDIPLDAWVSMLRDPGNIFQKSIDVPDETSALSVMQQFQEMELPADALPNGIKDVVQAVIPYVTDLEVRQKVEEQYEKLHADQDEIHQKASGIADRWLAFDVEMAESLFQSKATPYVRDFINEFHDLWGDTTRDLLYSRSLDNGELYMSRDLAVKIEEVRVKTLWLKSAVANGNADVINQMDQTIVAEILRAEKHIQQMIREGHRMHEILAADNVNNQEVAAQEVKGGGGCPGDISADVKTRENNAAASDGDSKEDGKEKSTKEEILKCVTCPLCNKGGVDARIQHFKTKKRITCSSCKGFKEYDK